jgi:hypothetical protein
MSTREQLIKTRLGMLAPADELKNIARACKLAGVSRSHFYEIQRAYETFGKEGLAPGSGAGPGCRTRRRPRSSSRSSA